MKRFVLLAAIFGLPALATAGHCPKVRRVVAVQAYVQPQAAYYQVGQDLQSEALADKIAARVLAKLEASATAADTAPIRQASLIVTHCAKCHSGAEAKASIDLSGDIDCETRLHAIWMLMHDDPQKRMPRGKELDAQTLGLIIQEFAALPE